MQTLFTPSRPHKGRPTTHQPSGGALTSTPGEFREFIGGHARTHEERMAALARIREKSAADFSHRDREIEGKKKGSPPPAPEWQKRAEREAREWFRDHPEVAEDDETDQTDNDDHEVANINNIDTDGNECVQEVEDEIEDLSDDEDMDERTGIDVLISRRESRADSRGHSSRPTLGFENGAPLGAETADICDRAAMRVKKMEIDRAAEAVEFREILKAYPINGVDYKILAHLCNPFASHMEIAKAVGRTDRAIRKTVERIRAQASRGKFHTRAGAGASGIDINDRAEFGAWLTQPLPKAASGRKKKGAIVRTPKKIRIPARLRLAPLVAVVSASAPRPYRPRRPRTRFVDPGQVDMFAFDMAA